MKCTVYKNTWNLIQYQGTDRNMVAHSLISSPAFALTDNLCYNAVLRGIGRPSG